MMREPGIVIVGTGLAGYTVAKEFRKMDNSTALTLLTQDDGAVYSKPMLSNAFGSNKSPAQLITHSAEHMAATLNAKVITHTDVTSIELANRVAVTGDDTLRYAQLVLALGADPVRPAFAANVFSVNSLHDYSLFRSAIEGKKHVAIIGAGLIGCEFANDLRRGGFEVTLIGPDALPLAHLLPAAVAQDLRAGLEKIGVRGCLGNAVKTVERDGAVFRVFLESGMMITADAVLSAIGLRPRTALAAAAGLQVNRGIVVDALLRSSDENVHALGDCAQVCGLVLPFVLPIMNAARALGPTLAGKPTPVSYPAMPVVVKTPACPLVVSPPAAGARGHWEIEGGDGNTRALFKDEAGKLLGFALSGECAKERQALAKELPGVLA